MAGGAYEVGCFAEEHLRKQVLGLSDLYQNLVHARCRLPITEQNANRLFQADADIARATGAAERPRSSIRHY